MMVEDEHWKRSVEEERFRYKVDGQEMMDAQPKVDKLTRTLLEEWLAKRGGFAAEAKNTDDAVEAESSSSKRK